MNTYEYWLRELESIDFRYNDEIIVIVEALNEQHAM